jgi:predicted kinase
LHLIAFKGLPGTGKSTLARALAQELRWPLIDKDDIKDMLDGHTPEAGGLAYDALFNLVRRQALLGLDVICDSPLTFERGYTRLREIAGETGATLFIVESTCSDEQVWLERIEARKTLSLPTHHQTDWQEFQSHRQWASATSAYSIHDLHLIVDTAQPLLELLSKITNWLSDNHFRLS